MQRSCQKEYWKQQHDTKQIDTKTYARILRCIDTGKRFIEIKKPIRNDYPANKDIWALQKEEG